MYTATIHHPRCKYRDLNNADDDVDNNNVDDDIYIIIMLMMIIIMLMTTPYKIEFVQDQAMALKPRSGLMCNDNLIVRVRDHFALLFCRVRL